ncbi:hypothetical protein GCM10027605_07490 [Micromonospora zhanjiangensis]
MTEITHADQGDRPPLGEPEHVFDLLDQQRDVVADPRVPYEPRCDRSLRSFAEFTPAAEARPSLETVS